MTRTTGVFCALVLSVAPAASAQVPAAATAAAPPITIAQAVDEALAHNLDLAVRRSDIAIADTAIVTARLRPNPVFSADADHLDWLGTGFNDVNNGGPTELSARVDVPMERGGKRDLRVGTATADRAVADATVADGVRALTETVELACIDVVEATNDLGLARDTLGTFQDLVTLNDARVQAGAAAPYEATRTRVAMEQFRATVTREELDLKTASIRLAALLGRPAIGAPIAIAPPLVSAQPVPDLATLMSLAIARRTDVRAALLTEARTAADLKLQIAMARVDVTWGAEYRRQAGPIGQSNSVGLFFSSELPLSNRNQGEIARAQVTGMQAHQQTLALDAAVRADVEAAYESYTTTAGLVTSIEHDLLAPARSARDTAAYTYRAGGSSLIELIDSQHAWNDAMQSYYDAQADYGRAVARLNAAVGTEVIR